MLTPADTAQLMNALNFSFYFGILVGAIVFIFLGNLTRFTVSKFYQPPRIKTREGYLYRFRGLYVTKEERHERIQKAREDYLIERKAGF